MFKIAFLFLTIANVFHESHWVNFFEGLDDYASIYVHSKQPLDNQSYFKQFEMSAKIETTWGNTMNAQIEMLKTALEDPDNEKFIFLSESTIPLTDFDTVYNELMQNGNSIFHFTPNPHVNKGIDYMPNAKFNISPLPTHKQFKTSQWVVLNRKHAQMMVDDEEYINIALQHSHDQEHYPATFLLANDAFHEITPEDTTFVHWHNKADDHPHTFTNLHDPQEYELLASAQQHGYLFARKLGKDCDLSPLNALLPYLENTATFYQKKKNVKTDTNTETNSFDTVAHARNKLNALFKIDKQEEQKNEKTPEFIFYTTQEARKLLNI